MVRGNDIYQRIGLPHRACSSCGRPSGHRAIAEILILFGTLSFEPDSHPGVSRRNIALHYSADAKHVHTFAEQQRCAKDGALSRICGTEKLEDNETGEGAGFEAVGVSTALESILVRSGSGVGFAFEQPSGIYEDFSDLGRDF
jgi:hypothetical protein